MDDLLDGLLVDASDAPPRRRTALLTVLGLVAVAVLGLGGWAGASWLRDRDLRSALAVSATALEALVERVEAASGARDLAEVVEVVPAARFEVARARTRAERSTAPRAAAVLAELAAHDAVLDALAPLPGMGPGPLQAWGQVRGPLQDALDGELAARRAVDGLDPDGALGAVDGLVPALEDVAGPLLARAADAEVDRVAGALQAARRTADLRSAGDLARAQRPYVRTTAELAPASAREAVQRCLRVLEALSTLGSLSGADAGAWPAARRALAPVGAPAVAAADRVVAEAVRGTDAWRAALPAVEAAQQAEAEELAAASRTVRGLASGYRPLDVALEPLLPALAARPPGPGDLDALAVDIAARDRLAQALTATVAPAAVAAEQGRLAAAATGEVAALQALQAGLARAGGPELDLLLQARTVATQARVAALQRWDAAAVRAAALSASRSLPPPPDL